MREIKYKDHRLFYDECFKVMDKLIEDGIKVDAIICDPTFGTTNRKNDIQLDFEEMWKRLIKLRRNKNTPIVLMANGLNYIDLVSSNRKMFKYEWIWNKVLPSGMLNVKRMPLTDFDDVPVFYEKQCVYNKQMTEGKPEHGRGNIKGKEFVGEESNYNRYKICTDNKGRTEKNPTRILNIDTDLIDIEECLDECLPEDTVITITKDHPSIVKHSQQKPIALGEYFVNTYTNEGDVVLDFMMGSGFVIRACNNLNRKAIGIDFGVCEKKKFKEYFEKPWNYVVSELMKIDDKTR